MLKAVENWKGCVILEKIMKLFKQILRNCSANL
jgi:hypothetical protein